MLAAKFLGQSLEPFDAFGNPLERLTPKQLDVGLFRRHLLRGCRCAAEVELRMTSFVEAEGARLQGRVFDGEVLTVESDVLLAPQPADQLQKLAGSVVSARLVEFDIAIGTGVVGAGDHVHQQPALAELVERRGGAGKVCGVPVAGADRDQRSEGGGPRGNRGRDDERVGPAPTGADQRAAEAALLGA